jgi:hypothetical protein
MNKKLHVSIFFYRMSPNGLHIPILRVLTISSKFVFHVFVLDRQARYFQTGHIRVVFGSSTRVAGLLFSRRNILDQINLVQFTNVCPIIGYNLPIASTYFSWAFRV